MYSCALDSPRFVIGTITRGTFEKRLTFIHLSGDFAGRTKSLSGGKQGFSLFRAADSEATQANYHFDLPRDFRAICIFFLRFDQLGGFSDVIFLAHGVGLTACLGRLRKSAHVPLRT
jgi:hypothetical protein